MREYEGFIRGLKEDKGKADFDQMFWRIEDRISAAQKTRLALASSLAVLLIGFVAYFTFIVPQANGNMLMSYVFEQESVDGVLISYVFED